jgi:hypothetical protein
MKTYVVTVSEVTTIRKAETHETVIGLDESSQGSEATATSDQLSQCNACNILGSLKERVLVRETRCGEASTHRTGIRLDVDTPLCRVQVERLESTFSAENFELVDILVTTVVTSIGETLGVLVGQDRTICLHGSPAGQVLEDRELVKTLEARRGRY